MKYRVLVSVVMSITGTVYASEAESKHMASARAKLAAMGDIGITARLERLPQISRGDEKAPSVKAPRVSPRVLATAIGREPGTQFTPKTIHVLPAIAETPTAGDTLKLPAIVKPTTESMPPAPAKKAVKGIDPNKIVAKKYQQKAIKKMMAATAIVHPAETADIEATTVVNVADEPELDPAILVTDVEPQSCSEKQEHNMIQVYHLYGDKMRREAWQM